MLWGTWRVANTWMWMSEVPIALGGAAASNALWMERVQRWVVHGTLEVDLRPSREFKVPVVEELPGNGHVVATITYLIDPQRAEGFKLQTRDSRRSLLRQGATGRELLRDMNKPGHHTEQIVDDS